MLTGQGRLAQKRCQLEEAVPAWGVAVGTGRMEKLLQAREECPGVLVPRRVAAVFGSDQVQAPSHVGDREAP